MSYYDIKGQQPLTAMQAYEQAEGGVLSVNAAGQLKLADRASRYAAGSAGGGFYDAQVTAAQPLAWWKLSDAAASGSAADSSGNAHPATATSITFGNTNEAVPGNTSASFASASTSHAQSTYNPSFASGITVEAWVNYNSLSQGANNPRLVASSHTDSDHNGFQLMISNSGQPQFWAGNGTSTGNAAGGTVPASGWTYIAGTYDGANVRIYVNGALQTTSGFTGTVTAGSGSGIGLGYGVAYSGDYLNGLLSEAAVYGTALSATQIAARYNAGPAGYLTLAAGQYGTDTNYKSNAQYLGTRACFATTDIPGGYPAAAAAAESDLAGPYTQNSGTATSPQAAPFADATATANTYSTDDVMDAGNWQVNVLGQPVTRLPQVSIDLRTLPAAEFSTAAFYGCDIGTAIQLAGLPAQAPDATGQPLAAYAVIEGINETLTDGEHTIQLYTSPLAQNAAWIPGDALLGVLGTTSTVGRSQSPAALGPPYPVPAFGVTLNRTGSAGAQDWRGLTVNVQNRLTPPLLIAQQASAQTITTLTGQAVTFDTLLADTAAGMGTTTTYTVPAGYAGYYWCSAVVQAASGTASAGGVAAWFSATLGGVNSHWHTRSLPYVSGAYTAVNIAGRIGPCAAGDTIQVTCAAAGTPANLPLGTADGGSMFTLIWQGA